MQYLVAAFVCGIRKVETEQDAADNQSHNLKVKVIGVGIREVLDIILYNNFTNTHT